jgi:hypothetical protein
MDKLMEKLMVAKAIMDKTENIKRGDVQQSMPINNLQDFDIPQAKYNIPQEYMGEAAMKQQTKVAGVPSVEAIKNSRLPDEIKKLMIEHPIDKPQQPQVGLSDELVERASRLMKEKSNNYIPESAKPKSNNTISESKIDYNIIKSMIKEAVDDALKENGLLVESSEKTNEIFSFRVGKHIFEGKISKIKKLRQ